MPRESVFISYAREDEEQAWRLFSDLERAGYSVWFDKIKLTPGAPWELFIRQAIDRCRFFIVLWSRNFVNSGYCQEELRKALDRLEARPGSRFVVVPALLENIAVEHPRLKERQWAFLFLSWDKGVREILSALGAKSAVGGLRRKEAVPVSPWFVLQEAGAALAYHLSSLAGANGPANGDRLALVVGLIGAAGLGKTSLCATTVNLLNRHGRPAIHIKLDGFLYSRNERRERGVCGYEPAGWRIEYADESWML